MKNEFLLIVVLFLFLCSGCASKKEEGVVTLRWVSDPNPARWEQIKRFEKANPGIKINLDWSSLGLEKVLTQIAGGHPPDLIDCSSWGIMLRIFAEKGVILDITDYCEKYKVDLKDIWENCYYNMYHKGRVYTIPTNAGTTVLLYNKKLFDKEAIPYPDDTWTWDEFLKAAKRLTKIDPEKKSYEYFGTGIGDIYRVLPWQYGAEFYSPDGKRCICDSEEYKKAFGFIYDLRYKHHVSPSLTEMQSMASQVAGWGTGEINLFCSGRLAMFFCARFAIINMRKVKDLEWGVAPLPYPKEGKRATDFATRSIAISSKCKHPEEAFKFLKFLLSKDYNETIAHGGDGFPVVISLCKSDFFLKDPAYPDETQNQVYIDAIKYSRPPQFSPYFDEMEVERIKQEEIEKIWAGLQDPEKALDNIAQRVNVLSRYEKGAR